MVGLLLVNVRLRNGRRGEFNSVLEGHHGLLRLVVRLNRLRMQHHRRVDAVVLGAYHLGIVSESNSTGLPVVRQPLQLLDGLQSLLPSFLGCFGVALRRFRLTSLLFKGASI